MWVRRLGRWLGPLSLGVAVSDGAEGGDDESGRSGTLTTEGVVVVPGRDEGRVSVVRAGEV